MSKLETEIDYLKLQLEILEAELNSAQEGLFEAKRQSRFAKVGDMELIICAIFARKNAVALVLDKKLKEQ